MKRIASFALFFAAYSLSACTAENGGTGGAGGNSGCDQVCQQSSQCDLEEICTNGCCVPWDGCTPGSCDAGEFCNPENLECTSVTAVCEEKGCDCHIVGSAGRVPTDNSNAKITLGPDTRMDITVIVTVDESEGGGVLPGADFTLGLDVATDFEIVTDTTILHALPGVTTPAANTLLTATVVDSDGVALIPSVSCAADLINLGDAPATGVRFYLFNDVTGAPVTGAPVIVDWTADGLDDGTTPVTGADGMTATVVDPAGPYTVTVFADGYNYLSLVGLTATDVALPLSPRGANATVGGLDGEFSFDKYEEIYLDSDEKLLKAGIVAASFPLRALLNFDFSMFIGTMAEEDCNENHDAPGCYTIEFPGFSEFHAPLPGGVVLSLTNIPIKPTFDAMAVPGRRYAWSLAGEFELTDIADFIPMLLDMTADCDCDDGVANNCPDACDCDEDCPLQIDFGAIFDGLLPLFSKFASGVQGGIPVAGGSLEAWQDYADDEYDNRVESATYPRLDRGTSIWSFGELVLLQDLSKFTTLATPTLPADPASGIAGATMEAMIVLAGVNSPGAGFVPLGLAAGLDCTAAEGKCLDRVANPTEFDGTVNASTVCDYHHDASQNQCPAAAGQGDVAAGNIGIFHAPPHSGLQGGEEMTVALALPLSSFMSDDGGYLRTTAYIDRGEPASNSLSSAVFPPTPTFWAPPAAGNVYQVATTAYDINWVTFATDEVDGNTTRWNVYFGSTGGNFVAPTPPGDNPLIPIVCACDVTSACDLDGVADCACDSGCGNGDIPTGAINVTHVGFDLASALDLDDLATNDETTLLDLINEVQGFGVASTNVCNSETGCPPEL